MNIYNIKLDGHDPTCYCGTQELLESISNAFFLLRTAVWGPLSKAALYEVFFSVKPCLGFRVWI